jgi:two-component system cell cycle response regulator DivK
MAKTVLIAEDQEDNRVIYSTILRHFGFTVLEASDGSAALEKARELRPDLMLLDVSMPHMTGWDVCVELKKSEGTKDIVIVMLTAHAQEQDRERSILCGADGYISKPIAPKAVVQRVKDLIGEP